MQEEQARIRAANKSGGKVPTRENFVRLQTRGIKKFKGRGSKAGGTKNIGWTKSGNKFGGGGKFSGKKGKCFVCGKGGHWAHDCTEGKREGLSDGEFQRDSCSDLLLDRLK